MKRQPGSRLSTLLHLSHLLTVVLTLWAGAALAESYVVLPLIGDRITVALQDQQVGSHLDRNKYQVIPQSDPNLDIAAARAADATIRKLRPDATITLLRATNPKLYAMRDVWTDTDAVDVRELLSLVAQQHTSTPDAYLLLILPYRAEPELKSKNSYRGTGKVAGLGFYVDSTSRWTSAVTGETAIGFLGVFANLQLVLINLQTSTIVAHERGVVGTTFAASRAEDKTPWNALSPERKDAVLKELMSDEIGRQLPKLLTVRQP
jgi:hypothetical protein